MSQTLECAFKETKEIIKKYFPKYRCNLTFKSKAFDFINLPKILRSKEVWDHLPSNFNISGIPMVFYNLNPSIRSTLFNYKQFVLHLNIDEFLKDPNSIKCCWNKYDNSFTNNHYGHIITGNLILLIMRGFINSFPKAQSIENQNKFVFRKLMKKYKLVFINSLSKYQMSKPSIRSIFLEWKSHVMSSVNKKNFTLKNKITCRSVKSLFSDHEDKHTLFSLKEGFVIVPIDKAGNNVAFICKHSYALTVLKELNLDCHLSNQER